MALNSGILGARFLGHARWLPEYRNRFCGATTDQCLKCKSGVGNAAHLFECGATVHLRRKHFGEKWNDPTVLHSNPKGVWDIIEEAKFLDDFLTQQ